MFDLYEAVRTKQTFGFNSTGLSEILPVMKEVWRRRNRKRREFRTKGTFRQKSEFPATVSS